MLQHRSLQPSGPSAPGPSQPINPNRLNESFEVIRQEFDLLASELGVARTQRDEFESKVSGQVNELNIIRQSLYDLEAQHGKIRKQYEEELSRTRAELHALRQNLPPHATTPHPQVAPGPGPGPATIGPGRPFDPFFNRPRDSRDGLSDRDPLDRERERERERLMDQRDAKRLKADRMKPERGGISSPHLTVLKSNSLAPIDMYSPSLPNMPKLPPPGQTMSGPGIPSMPSQGLRPPSAAASPMVLDAPNVSSGSLMPTNTSGTGSFLDDIDPQNVPQELKKEGSDWFALFNPKVKRVLDVNLVHTLMHESVVCCVRFSADGKYLATGCNRTAQIYDTKTGAKTCVLLDETVGKAGDLYIRSVCFSPDGKYLATGAEDKQIRIWDIAKKRIRNVFDGHQQEIYSLDFSQDGRLIVSGSGDKTARIWDMTDGTSKVLTINDPDSLNNDAGVTSVAISPNGQFVAAGSLDTVVRIWDVATGTLLERLRGHRDSVYSVAFTPDGKGLVSGSLDKTLKYWDVSGLSASGVKSRKEGANGSSANGPGVLVRKESEKASSQCTMNFTGHKDYVLSVAVSHDGQWVVSGSKDRGVQFWNAQTALVQCMLQGHKNSVISIDLSPSGSVLATGSGDWQARIWSYTTN
ncbi:WD40 repeat-like protein [Armillaria solidipes]|uniref:WD40 repeat-like protein n=1 Tax=Armillaria solidipes TaxID=1076256 RepID=A0A2H3AS41_9AGAR|nr:WD40 repeat-like protein [Armillaria solidipes]